MTDSLTLLLFVFCLLILLISGEEEIVEPVLMTSSMITLQTTTTTVTTTSENKEKFREADSDAIWCPTHRIGNQCPDETLLSFYKCCGHLNKECCFHLRVWVVIMIIVLPVCLVFPASTFLVRRICCSAPRLPRGSNPSPADRVRQLAAEDSGIARRDSSDDMVML